MSTWDAKGNCSASNIFEENSSQVDVLNKKDQISNNEKK